MNVRTAFARQVSRALHDEHRANLDLLSRVEQVFAHRSARDATLATVFGRQIEYELSRHFNFEERALFPRLSDAGAGDLANVLCEEHETIRNVAGELLPLARTAATLDDAGWVAFRRCALEMVERLRSHIDKENAALLPTLDDVLDVDTDRELAFAYASA